MCIYSAATAVSEAPKKESVSTSYMLYRPDHPEFGRVKYFLTGFEPSTDFEIMCISPCMN